MTKGCKIWLWLLMFGGVISVLTGLLALSQSTSVGIYTMCMGLLQLGAVSLLLFKQRKEGFYLLCAIVAVNFFYNITHQINIMFALLSLVTMPLITYYFINKGSNGRAFGTSSNATTVPDTTAYNGNSSPEYTNVNNGNGSTGQTQTYTDASNHVDGETMNGATNEEFKKTSAGTQKKAPNFGRAENAFDGKAPAFGTKNMDITVDLYKELEIDRAWDEKSIRNHLKNLQKLWTQRQGATNDKEQLLMIDKVLKSIEDGYRFLTKAMKRKQYDQALEFAYKAGKIVDEAEEKLYTLLDQARAYYRRGNIQLATKFAEEAVEGKVNDASAYDLLARCYFDTNAYDKALNMVDQGIAVFKENINLHWLGARIATIGTKNFDDAQQRVNTLIELAPDSSIGHSEQVYLHLRKGDEQLAFQEIDSYIAAHPDDNTFKRGVAYDLDSYSNTCYYYDAAQNASFIADKDSYEKCLTLRTKAVEIFNDEHTQNQLEKAQYYGQKEWNDWNLPSIKSLAIYGTIFAVLGFSSEVFLALGFTFYAIMGVLIYFSFRPYWQIYKTYVTGQMGTAEQIVNVMGEMSARAAEWMFRALIQIVGWIFKFIFGLMSGKWF